MKKIENLTEKKDLINTFKKIKSKVYLNKAILLKNKFYLNKFKFKILLNLNLNKTKKKVSNIFLIKSKLQSSKQLKFYTKVSFSFSNFLIFYYMFIFTKIVKPTTSTQKFKKISYFLKFSKIPGKFKFFFKNNSGRNNQGITTVLSKSNKPKKSSILNNTLPSLQIKSFFSVCKIFSNKTKLFCLNKYYCGSVFISPYIDGIHIGQKSFSSNLPQKYWLNNLPGNIVLLKFLSKFNLCSSIFISNYKKYATANGTFCQIIDNFLDFNLIKISLPSKKTKIISGWNFIVLGRNSQLESKFNFLGKAGINRLLGKKPKVRGVARNPVDHPHGGRTKTNQPEVSIWGWIAKKGK